MVSNHAEDSQEISIHTLHTEGDFWFPRPPPVSAISIHTLHTEGDTKYTFTELTYQNFNPHPPHGG